MPEVYIGDNSVIGAGAVVTRDISANAFVVGNPVKVLREISDYDDIYYNHGKLVSKKLGTEPLDKMLVAEYSFWKTKKAVKKYLLD